MLLFNYYSAFICVTCPERVFPACATYRRKVVEVSVFYGVISRFIPEIRDRQRQAVFYRFLSFVNILLLNSGFFPKFSNNPTSISVAFR